jgi:hypothetical protein
MIPAESRLSSQCHDRGNFAALRYPARGLRNLFEFLPALAGGQIAFQLFEAALFLEMALLFSPPATVDDASTRPPQIKSASLVSSRFANP